MADMGKKSVGSSESSFHMAVDYDQMEGGLFDDVAETLEGAGQARRRDIWLCLSPPISFVPAPAPLRGPLPEAPRRALRQGVARQSGGQR